MKHLVFQMSGPLMAFGNEGGRMERPTDDHPRKSGVLGLVGAALGLARNHPWHRMAADGLGFASITLRSGHRLLDYHTVLTPEGKTRYETRRDQVAASDYTVQTEREYLSDAYFLAVLWGKQPSLDLRKTQEALLEPVWEPFAGRKACSFWLPLAPEIVDCDTLVQAFTRYERRLWMELLPESGEALAIHWEEGHPDPGAQILSSETRADKTENLSKSLYGTRVEHAGRILF